MQNDRKVTSRGAHKSGRGAQFMSRLSRPKIGMPRPC